MRNQFKTLLKVSRDQNPNGSFLRHFVARGVYAHKR